jgi:hypothetical protein
MALALELTDSKRFAISNYREKQADIFTIKIGSAGKIRLFFHILNHPWETLIAINEFRQEQGKLEAELVSLKEMLTEEKLANAKLREEIYGLKRGQG